MTEKKVSVEELAKPLPEDEEDAMTTTVARRMHRSRWLQPACLGITAGQTCSAMLQSRADVTARAARSQFGGVMVGMLCRRLG